MNSKDEERLAAFEKMLEFVQKNHDDTEAKMEILRGEGKNKTATYGQLMGNKMMYRNLLDLYILFDII